MQSEVADLTAQHHELDALVAELTEPQWQEPSALEGWTICDVVLHLAQTDEMASASLDGRLQDYFHEVTAGLPTDSLPAGGDVDEMAGALVAVERGSPGREVLERWRRASAGVRQRLAGIEPSARVEWVAGTMAARSLAATRISECWIHTTDVAAGLGVELEPTGRLRHIVRLAWRTIPYAFERAGLVPTGPVDVVVDAPDGSTWEFRHDAAVTTVRGPAVDLCRVAGQRARAADTALTAEGLDAAVVLEVIRTFA